MNEQARMLLYIKPQEATRREEMPTCTPPRTPGTTKQAALAEDPREHTTSPSLKHFHPKHGPREPMRSDSKHHPELLLLPVGSWQSQDSWHKRMGTLARRLWIGPGEISIEHRGHLLAQSPPSTVRKPTSERMEQKGKVGFSLCEEAHATSVLGCLLVLTSDSLVDTHSLCSHFCWCKPSTILDEKEVESGVAAFTNAENYNAIIPKVCLLHIPTPTTQRTSSPPPRSLQGKHRTDHTLFQRGC